MEVNTLYKDLMFSVLRLVTTRKDGDGNVGTCLIVDLEVVPGSLTPVLVTNRHVLEHAVEISIHLTASEGPRKVALGHTVQVRMELEGDRFFSTDDDVDIAIIPFGAVLREFEEQYPGYKPFWRSLPVSEFPSEEEYASLDALEDVFFLGFPDGRWDSVNQTPIIRRGGTATPATLDFDGKPAFLIDASVFQGSSGSPLFIARTDTLLYNSRLIRRQLALFAGIVTESYNRKNPINVFETEYEIDESLDLGVVTNVAAIKKVLSSFCEYAELPPPDFRTSPLSETMGPK